MSAPDVAGRRVAVVLGMHNSGTSLVAQIVGTLGAPLGDRVLTRASFSVDKPYDYWEHAIITELHEELLGLLDRHWGTARGAAPIADEVWDSELVAPFRRRMVEVVAEELALVPGLWAFKDPRTPRFLPLWRRIFAEMGVTPVYVISTRPAGAVARSFANKAVVPADWAEALWRRTYLDILRGTEGCERIFIDYGAWFSDSAATVARLDDFLGAKGDRDAALALIDPSKLSDFGRNPRPASARARAVDEALRRAAEGQDVSAEVAACAADEDAADAARSEMELDCSITLGGRRSVAIVTPELAGPFRNGGIGTAFAGLAEALAQAGHAVTVLHAVTDPEQWAAVEAWAGRYAERGVTLKPLGLPGDVYAATLKAFEALRGEAFDVIHVPDWMALGYALVQAKRQGLAFRDTTLVCGTHGSYRWARQANREALSHWWPLLWDHLERRAVEGADVVVSPSAYLRDWMRGQGWALPPRCFAQPNVYPGTPPATGEGAFPPPRELVFFGRLEERKGLLLFLDALDELARHRPLPPLTFLGRSTTVRGRDGAEVLAERAAPAGWSYSLIQDMGRDEALEYLRGDGRLAVVPSLLENSPFTVLECVVEGIPLLASDVGGVAELLRPEDAGMLFAAEPKALADRLERALAHGTPRARPRLDIAANRSLWQVWHHRLPPARGPEPVAASSWTLWLEPGARALPDAARLADAGATAGADAAWGITGDDDGHRWLGLNGPDSLLALYDLAGRGALALSPKAAALLASRGITPDQPHALWRAALTLRGAGLDIAAVPLAAAHVRTLLGIVQPLDPARRDEALALLPLDDTARDLARLAGLPPATPPAPEDGRREAPTESLSWRLATPLRLAGRVARRLRR